MRVAMPLGSGQKVELIGNPLRLSKTPVTYAKAPPDLGADTGAVLARVLGLTGGELRALAAAGAIAGELDA
jgi:crotonobetainyl-CoA:carnitine CoA-transferase CaiB-like acyl-CoA transferase